MSSEKCFEKYFGFLRFFFLKKKNEKRKKLSTIST